MKKTRLVFSYLLLAVVVFGQETYVKSSIITCNNDTVKGFISNSYDCKTFFFKKNANDKPTVYTPQLLRGVIMDGNVFESRVVHLPFYRYDNPGLGGGESRLTKIMDKGITTDTAFLQKLVQGVVNLYSLKTTGGRVHYFVEKNGSLKEIPPEHYVKTYQENMRLNLLQTVNLTDLESTRFTDYRFRPYLDTLAEALDDKTFLTTKSKIHYNEKSLSFAVADYNKKQGIPKGGVLKNKISQRWFMGVNAGLIYLSKDAAISDTKINSSIAIRAFILRPLTGVNRYVSFKTGFNYFSYQSDFYKRTIGSLSAGLRTTAVSGFIRPYAEGSISVSGQLLKSKRTVGSIHAPLILEIGAILPIQSYCLTVGISHTPVVLVGENGYKFWVFNVGIMF